MVFDREGHDLYNIGTGVPTSDYTVFETVRDAVGATVKPIFAPPRLGEVQHICLNAAKAERELGWCPQVSFAEGVRRAVEYYRKLLKGSRR